MQCASSTATQDTPQRTRSSSSEPPSSRSGATNRSLSSPACRWRKRPGFLGRQRRVEVGGRHAVIGQRIDLIFHECDERRDDDGKPGSQERRQLIAQRLATAGRQQRKDVPASQRVGDDLLLQRPKAVVAKEALERRSQIQPTSVGAAFGRGGRWSAASSSSTAGPRAVEEPMACCSHARTLADLVDSASRCTRLRRDHCVSPTRVKHCAPALALRRCSCSASSTGFGKRLVRSVARAHALGWLALLCVIASGGCTADRGAGDDEADGGLRRGGPFVAPPIFGPGADPTTVEVFGGAMGGEVPQAVYPFDGVMLAQNINQMRLAFVAAASHSFYRLTVESPRYRQVIYLGDAACSARKCSYLVDDKVWARISHQSGGRATLTIDGTSGAGQPVGRATLQLQFRRRMSGAGCTTSQRRRVASCACRSAPPSRCRTSWARGRAASKTASAVTGVSRDGKKVAAVFNLPDGYAGIVDGADPSKYILEPIESDGARLWNFASFSPDGSRLITVWNGTLSLRDGTTGKLIKNVPGSLLGGVRHAGVVARWRVDRLCSG